MDSCSRQHARKLPEWLMARGTIKGVCLLNCCYGMRAECYIGRCISSYAVYHLALFLCRRLMCSILNLSLQKRPSLSLSALAHTSRVCDSTPTCDNSIADHYSIPERLMKLTPVWRKIIFRRSFQIILVSYDVVLLISRKQFQV
jgi:hypothetical protein